MVFLVGLLIGDSYLSIIVAEVKILFGLRTMTRAIGALLKVERKSLIGMRGLETGVIHSYRYYF